MNRLVLPANTLEGLNVEASAEKLSDLLKSCKSEDEKASVYALAMADPRLGVQRWATDNGYLPSKGPDDPPAGTPLAPPPPARKEPMPLRFICHHGCPRSFEPITGNYQKVTQQNGMETQQFVPGVTVKSEKFGADKRVRVIDVPALSCCKRGTHRVEPEAVSKLILDSRFRDMDAIFEMKGGNRVHVPMIQTQAEWDELLSDERGHAEQIDALKRELEQKQLAKRGKRGV